MSDVLNYLYTKTQSFNAHSTVLMKQLGMGQYIFRKEISNGKLSQQGELSEVHL